MPTEPTPPRTSLGRRFLRSGLAVAVGLAVVLEVALHRREPAELIVYADSDGRSAYRAARQSLDRLEPAEVMFVGSSRVRDGISAPTIARLAEERLGRPVRVANYGLAGACADSVSALLDRAAGSDSLPALLCYGVSPTQFRERAGLKRQAEFWDLSDWIERFDWGRSQELGKVLPGVVRNELERFSCVLRYRDWFRHGARHGWSRPASADNPLQGQEAAAHAQEQDRERTDFDVAATRLLLAKYLKGRTLSDDQVEHLRQLARTCAEHEVRLVLFEVPFPPTVQALLPRRYLPRFRAQLSTLCDELGAEWRGLPALEFEPRDEDFRDRAHLGREGHRRYSQQVFDKVVHPAIPFLRRRGAASTQGS